MLKSIKKLSDSLMVRNIMREICQSAVIMICLECFLAKRLGRLGRMNELQLKARVCEKKTKETQTKRIDTIYIYTMYLYVIQ